MSPTVVSWQSPISAIQTLLGPKSAWKSVLKLSMNVFVLELVRVCLVNAASAAVTILADKARRDDRLDPEWQPHYGAGATTPVLTPQLVLDAARIMSVGC